MANSVGGAIKAYLEQQGLGLRVYRERVTEPTLPYIRVREAVSLTPSAAFPQHDDPEGHVDELVQIDLWQDAAVEKRDSSLADRVALKLKACRLPAAPMQVVAVRLIGMPKIADPDPTLVHHAATVQVRRVLARS